MKNLALLFTFCFIALVLWQWNSRIPTQHQAQVEFDPSWRVYEKTEETKLTMRPPTQEEETFLGARVPASQEEAKAPLFEGRRVIGNLNFGSDQLMALNDPHPDWEENFAQEMMRFQDNETKFFIKRVGPLILAQGSQYRTIEEVIVNFQKESGEITSFKAWVDGESGQLLNSWDRSIVHNYRKRPLTFSLQDAEAL